MMCMRFRKFNVKWLLLNSVNMLILPCCIVQANNLKGQDMSMDSLIDSLLVVTGQDYIDKEIQLRQSGSQAISALKTRLNGKDVFARFYSKTIISWMEGLSPNNDAALKYLEELPTKLAMTPVTNPPPSGVAAYLTLHFQSSVSGILAVHLIKLPELPHWHTAAILLYLEELKSQEVTGILLRFVSETTNDDYKDVVLSTIDATSDPQLDSKILQEEIRLKSLNLNLPLSLKGRHSKP